MSPATRRAGAERDIGGEGLFGGRACGSRGRSESRALLASLLVVGGAMCASEQTARQNFGAAFAAGFVPPASRLSSSCLQGRRCAAAVPLHCLLRPDGARQRQCYLRPEPLPLVAMSSTEVRSTSSGQVNNWRPSASGDFSDDDDEEESSVDDTVAGMRNGVDVSEQVVLGGGALRGEQEAYSMRDLQSMKVPRLRSMCEARGLKKIGTKPQLINRLLASTPDAMDPSQSDIIPMRLVQRVSNPGDPSQPSNSWVSSPPDISQSSGSSPVSAHAISRGGGDDELEDDLLSDDEFFSGSTEESDGSVVMRRGPHPVVDREPAPFMRMDAYQTTPDYRPSGKDLEKIMNAPRMVRRAGKTYMMESSKLDKYEKDQLKQGSKFIGSELPMDRVGKEAPYGRLSAPTADNPEGTELIENARATTLNDIPREFLPPSLRSFDPASQNRRRGPGRPRQEDETDEAAGSEWDMVKAGGGMHNQPGKSPFDDMIREDLALERAEAQDRKKNRGPAEVSASVRRLLGNRAATLDADEKIVRRARRLALDEEEEELLAEEEELRLLLEEEEDEDDDEDDDDE
mmetsp:Transcript_28684/g.65622  ORF Transcript_28684/g.65622 Transcript_28684/m.65622 type:complete len:572 (-) Transcript_28684:185-1900(-)